MFKNLRNTITALLGAVMLVAIPLAVPAIAAADDSAIQTGVCGGANSLQLTNDGGCAQTTTGTDKLNKFITQVVNVFSIIVGIVAVIMIIVGGFRYITSNGDSNNITSAKNTIIYAIIGLIIVALAQFIVQFVLNKVSNQGS